MARRPEVALALLLVACSRPPEVKPLDATHEIPPATVIVITPTVTPIPFTYRPEETDP